MTLRILSVQNIYTNRFDVPKVSFKSNRGDTYGKERINRKEFYEDNYNDAFNKEYQPVKYDKITMVHGKPAVLPSERMLRQNKSSFRENELFYDDVDSIDFVLIRLYLRIVFIIAMMQFVLPGWMTLQ